MLIELSSAVPPPASVEVQPWSLCDGGDGGDGGVGAGERRVHDALRARREREGGKKDTLPTLWPLHTTYASSDPQGDARFLQDIFRAVPIAEQIPDANGTCALQVWAELPGTGGVDGTGLGYDYQIRFASSPNKPAGDQAISDFEIYLSNLHGDIDNIDNDGYVCGGRPKPAPQTCPPLPPHRRPGQAPRRRHLHRPPTPPSTSLTQHPPGTMPLWIITLASR